MIKIGIDPGSTVGVAILFKETKALHINQFTCLYEAMQHLDEFSKAQAKTGESLHFVIEDARLVKGNRFFAAKNGTSKNQGVGDVKGNSREWERFCKFLGLSYELRPPANTKITPEEFERLTGIKTPKTKSHMRDAALLIIKS